MKKFGIYFLLSASLVGMTLNSCDKDEFSEEDAMNLQDKLNKQGKQFDDTLATSKVRVSYTVNVVDASTSALKSGSSAVNAITGAVVKLVQDTAIRTATVDASGIVTFTNLKPGKASVNITLANYSEVNYVVNLGTTPISGGSQLATIIPLIPIAGTQTATISGKVTFDSDLSNKASETVPVGTKVLAMVNPGSITTPSGIDFISYDNLSLTATTDANGNYTMTVPATVNGLEYYVYVPDFAADQRLIVGEDEKAKLYNASTNFGLSFTNSPSFVEDGKYAQVIIGAPDYTFTPATATAVIDNSMGVDYMHNVNVGSGYEPYAVGSFTIDNPNTEGGDASVDVTVDGYGHISAYIDGSGSKFDQSFDGKEIVIPYFEKEAKAKVTAVDANGKITAYELSVNHRGVIYPFVNKNFQFVKHTGNGSGAVTELPSRTNLGDGTQRFNEGTVSLVTPVGSGYAVGDSLILSVKTDDKYKGKIYLKTGSVTAINITNQGANYLEAWGDALIDIVFSSPAVGTTATATAYVKDGKIESIEIDNPGSGYKTAPTITIHNKAEKVQAVAYAVLNDDGQVSYVSVENQGNGYLTVPTVTIQPINGVGSGATAYAVVSDGKVTSIEVVSKGSGYLGNKNYEPASVSAENYIEVIGAGNQIVNFYLGTGVRTVND